VTGLIGINRDITAYRQAQQTLFERTRLRDALDREKELSDLKTRVMTRIAHEFRTPLAIIGTSSHILSSYYERLDDEKKQRHFTQIRMQINRLSEMLNDISMTLQGVAQTDGTEVGTFVAAPISLPRVCRDAIAQVRLTLDSDRQIILSSDSGLPPIYADERLLRRALINLLSNAIKYSPAEGQIHLEVFVEDDDETVTLRISDEGIGIPENEHNRIFEPLYRGSNIGEVPGLGLGLALVKDAVDQHQGSIEVSSAPGRGSVFTIHLSHQRSAPQ
jgi:signal transduction histidine kinase